ncbi:MAG: acyl-ACP--UDP-N-acetylglucosamine O-acyltransferase [Gammaproteobacteria bacterium]|nr:MAG: acyl-ACP--UDP-N-acetylglucosamine O-acyltransferase [Gammaproteobacteria bacterium]
MNGVHPTAIVSPAAELAPDVQVGPYAVIGPDVEIGSGTRIGAHTVVSGPTRIGRDNRIYPHASIGDDPQDKKYAGERTRLEIGDGNTIREFCTINRGTVQDGAVTRIGNDNWLMAYVHIAHDCQLGDHIILANNTSLAGHVHMEDWVICSGFAAVHQFCRIGAHSFLGPYVGMTRDVPPYMMVVGTPPQPRGINAEGLKRRGFSPEQIRNVKEAARILYRSGLRLAEAMERLEALSAAQPELGILVEFLRRSERGIIR